MPKRSILDFLVRYFVDEIDWYVHDFLNDRATLEVILLTSPILG